MGLLPRISVAHFSPGKSPISAQVDPRYGRGQIGHLRIGPLMHSIMQPRSLPIRTYSTVRMSPSSSEISPLFSRSIPTHVLFMVGTFKSISRGGSARVERVEALAAAARSATSWSTRTHVSTDARTHTHTHERSQHSSYKRPCLPFFRREESVI